MNTKEKFQDFIILLKEGSRDLFRLIDTPESKFESTSFEELISNTDDVLVGVNKVLKNFNDRYFNCFNGCLVKYHDNGDVKFIFYTETTDAPIVTIIAKILLNELGNGYYKSADSFPFSEHERIADIASSRFERTFKDLCTVWHLKDLSILLQYRIEPLHQFSLMVTQKVQAPVDKSIRRNGTLLNLLSLDIASLLNKRPLNETKEIENGITKFVDYSFQLEELQLDIFDAVTIRIFSAQKTFSPDLQTHVTLTSSKSPDYFAKKSVAEKLIQLYGPDNIGSGDLTVIDIDSLEKDDWLGRRWSFNQFNGLVNYDNKEEKFAYQVSVGNTLNENDDFGISILCFNELLSLFGIEE